ncbi:MAG: type II secretion system protein [Elusimicrobia bacterium]|nr:type II secretion system protein [Elusimicrobiota bacterium]
MKTKKGFTLIELMIVVAIIGILAAIAIPKFADLIKKSKEGSTKGSLGALRSALTIYYGEQEGVYPVASTDGLANSEGTDGYEAAIITFSNSNGPFLTKYLDKMPSVKLGITGLNDKTDTVYGSSIQTSGLNVPGNQGCWWYRGSAVGEMHVISSQYDTKGAYITSW